jgi:hypothetical protein
VSDTSFSLRAIPENREEKEVRGGISMHHKAKFFFFGVILGEYCVGAFWSAMSVIIGAPIYDFAPG